ncbi:hypothetical protein OTU49_010904 [Cherax quadricarinatus]|uniref:WAP domain-containing protein n=1 Tax=Cherax quadricarinatus TaxID=27406 RepID=A0AAW0WF10_CHEQU|nr:uncharacterized protein LOC128704244 [Cherax quadricarinatus]
MAHGVLRSLVVVVAFLVVFSTQQKVDTRYLPPNRGFGGNRFPGIGGNLGIIGSPGVGGVLRPGGGGGVLRPGGGGGGRMIGDDQGCRYYCRRPGNDLYCCEDESDPFTRPALKLGICPAVGRQCSRDPVVIGCSNDSRCPGQDKCCYDVCYQRHICTRPSLS